jgi:type IV pilus assembly protein PilB
VEAAPPSQIYEDLLAPDAGALDESPERAAERRAAADAAAKIAADERAAATARDAAARAGALASKEADEKAASAMKARAEAADQVTVEEKLPLQSDFKKLLMPTKEAPKAGFFGGSGAKLATNEEKLVGDVVQLILQSALRVRASDIHLEPQEAYLRVRFRIDGILEEVLRVKHTLNLRVVSNIRVACSLDPEKGAGGKPEDGRVSVKIDGREADLRLSTFPTAFGDKAVLRVIPRTSKAATLDELGLEPASVELLRTLLARPQGLLIVTGPTGSGKSTTLYASLEALNDASRNIVTLEDPIERKVPGITQGMIQPRQGFGFAEGLRAILRQDPNVIMVGEIRDTETAEIALSAALTGHLLLTTLHTVSALGAVNRMIDMGLEPFLVASAITAVTAQRLARTVCPSCAEPYSPTAAELSEVNARAKKAGVTVPEGFGRNLKRGAGCVECRGTGYLGRVLVFEIVVLTPPLREAILRKGSVDDLREAAAKGGMEPLLLDGLRKASDGRVPLAEILRVIDSAD